MTRQKLQQLKLIHRRVSKNSIINKQVEDLKRQLKAVNLDYYRRAYLILRRIIQLRKTQIKGYGVHNLSKEKGIDLSPHQISYIFGYDYLSDYTKSEIDKGNMKTSTALFIVKQDKRFRDADVQDRVVKLHKDGRLKVDEIGRMKDELLFDRVNHTNQERRANKELMNITYRLKEFRKEINSHANIYTNRSLFQSVMSETEKLLRDLEQAWKFGRGFKRK